MRLRFWDASFCTKTRLLHLLQARIQSSSRALSCPFNHHASISPSRLNCGRLVGATPLSRTGPGASSSSSRAWGVVGYVERCKLGVKGSGSSGSSSPSAHFAQLGLEDRWLGRGHRIEYVGEEPSTNCEFTHLNSQMVQKSLPIFPNFGFSPCDLYKRYITQKDSRTTIIHNKN